MLIVMAAMLLFTACATPAAPTQAPPPTEGQAVEQPKEVPPTKAPEPTTPPAAEKPVEEPAAEGPCLIVGALYGGPMNDAGYNQAMHESMMEMNRNIPCVKLIEAENVPDEAGAKTTMENMLSQGAKLIFATAFNHQNPAFELAEAHKDVIFEHAGGWMMSDNFANYFGAPPNGWYAMGVAAGLMTETNKVGFVAAFPLGWTVTFINAFTLGARSVNPDVETIVAYTFAWGDRAKEADTTNSLINQGVDLITMHVDSPSTVISTAEERGTYSIGFQDLAAQQFAPEYWVTGTGFTLGGKITWLTQSVIDGTWEPIFLRCGVKDGCMAVAPFGSKVPQEVQDQVLQAIKDADDGKIVVFQGPIKGQAGEVKVPDGETLSDDVLSSLDWFVEGVVGSPK
jgi:basic membrane lipoprotein Med (substrate-binding protein (PBP1-ABC) superfamily)